MLNFKKLKTLICPLFIFLIVVLPIGNVFADDPVTNLGTNIGVASFLGPIGIPAAFLLTGLQTLSTFPEAKTVGNALNPVQYVYSGIAMAAGSFLGILSDALLQTGKALLGYVIDGNFIGKSVTDIDSTSSSYNSTVALGWGIARNLANAALVIGLVIIAISIILGREENKAKKTLINFIIIALLINFTPVICGFIVDGSNILTKSFMSGGINNGFMAAIYSALAGANGLGVSPIVILFTGIILLMFSLVAFFIYVMYALLFLARYVILMILVIASPIAFATKVFPQSKYIKKIFPSILYWDDWWENFIQWCVIGIPAGLFIFLSNAITSQLSYEAITATASTSNENIISTLISGLFAYSVPMIVLIAGFFITISAGGQVGSYLGGVATGAWAASGGRIMNKGKELGGATVGWAGERVGAAGTWAKEGVAGRIGGAISNVAGNDKIDTSTKEGREEGRYKFREYLGKPREWAAKHSLVAPETVGKKSGEEVAAETMAKGVSFNTYEKMKERYSQPQRTAIEKKLAEEDLSKFLEGAKNSPVELERRLKSVANTGNDKTKNNAYLHTINNPNLAAGGTNWDKVFKTDLGKSLSSMNAKDVVENVTPESLENVDVFSQLTSKQLKAIIERGSRKQTNSVRSMLKGKNKSLLIDRRNKLKVEKKSPGISPDRVDEIEREIDDQFKKEAELIKLL